MVLFHSRAATRLAIGLAVGGMLALGTMAPAGAAQSVAPQSTASRSAAPQAAASQAGAAQPAGTLDYRSACAATAAAGYAHCDALVRTDLKPLSAHALLVTPDIVPSGYGPSSLLSAYGLDFAAAGGAGQTVAVVDAYNDPNINGDLAVYRAQYGLPACTEANGCLKVIGQTGSPSSLPPNAPVAGGWAEEESLDLDMVSAICSNCHILLVEANSTNYSDLGTAENQAVAQGAKFISNSYSGVETSAETGYDSSYYDHPGIVVTASAGDNGYGAGYPAASPYVTAVGGTSLTPASNVRGWSETAWAYTGSGCSAYEPKPAWQKDTGCAHRTIADVSADADPNTGVAVYDTFNGEGGWDVYGGTSVAAPIIASTYALAGPAAAGSNPAQDPYLHTAVLNDVTSGSNGTCSPVYLCTGEVGYDGPTGLGTPAGIGAFTNANAPVDMAFQENGNAAMSVETSTGGYSGVGIGLAAGSSPSITTLAAGGFETAFAGPGGQLWVDTVGSGSGLQELEPSGVMPNTSPAIAALAGGGWEVAYQNTNGTLIVLGNGGDIETNLTMAAHTSPSIAASPDGQFEVAFQSSGNTLWTYSPSGNSSGTNSGLGMASNTNPAIAALPNGGYQMAFQANTGILWTAGSLNPGGNDYNLGMAPGTSPAISALPTGAYHIAFQANTNVLWMAASDSDSDADDTNLSMSPGTSPSIAALLNGEYAMSFQANSGQLWIEFSDSNFDGWSLNEPIAPGTSPAIATPY